MLVEREVSFAGQLPNPGRPHEDCEDVVAADPAIVFVAVACVDAPLSRARHDSLVTKLSLDNALLEVDTSHHLLAHLISSHRLHDVAHLQTLSQVFPLLILRAQTLKFDGGASMHLHQAAPIHW